MFRATTTDRTMKKTFDKTFVAKSLYGSITLLAVLLSLEDHLPTAWHGASLLFGTALSVALAEAFSESIGQVIAGKKQLDRAELVEIWHETHPVLSAAYLPLLMMVLAGFGLFSVSTAITLAEGLIYATLFVYGLRIGYLLHGRKFRVLLAGLFTLGIGGLIGLIKLLFH